MHKFVYRRALSHKKILLVAVELVDRCTPSTFAMKNSDYKVGMIVLWRPRSWLFLVVDCSPNNGAHAVLIDNNGEDDLNKVGSIIRIGKLGGSLHVSQSLFYDALEEIN